MIWLTCRWQPNWGTGSRRPWSRRARGSRVRWASSAAPRPGCGSPRPGRGAGPPPGGGAKREGDSPRHSSVRTRGLGRVRAGRPACWHACPALSPLRVQLSHFLRFLGRYSQINQDRLVPFMAVRGAETGNRQNLYRNYVNTGPRSNALWSGSSKEGAFLFHRAFRYRNLFAKRGKKTSMRQGGWDWRTFALL